MSGENNYAESQMKAKRDFVADALARTTPARVLDIGCNTGAFSHLAARQGADVVAVDFDSVVVACICSTPHETGLSSRFASRRMIL
jgi:ribosomal protein L11 methylase PrmA